MLPIWKLQGHRQERYNQPFFRCCYGHSGSNKKILQKIVEKNDVMKLPCPVEFMNQNQSKAWLDVELKKDYIPTRG